MVSFDRGISLFTMICAPSHLAATSSGWVLSKRSMSTTCSNLAKSIRPSKSSRAALSITHFGFVDILLVAARRKPGTSLRSMSARQPTRSSTARTGRMQVTCVARRLACSKSATCSAAVCAGPDGAKRVGWRRRRWPCDAAEHPRSAARSSSQLCDSCTDFCSDASALPLGRCEFLILVTAAA